MGHSIPAACLKLVMILLMALPAHLILGCGPTYTVPPHYYACEYDYVIEQEGRMAERGGKDCALHNAQLGSAALAAGRADLAHGAFSRACKTMLSFEPDGEWKAIVVEERAKEWRGDPYEQLVAYLLAEA